MGMTLDEAIKHCEEVADANDKMVEYDLAYTDEQKDECRGCASEHRQLAEWLKELKKYKDKDMMLIYANPLAEAVRCAMCTNPMRSNSGCDGGCKVDEQMYRSVMDAVNELIMEVNADES